MGTLNELSHNDKEKFNASIEAGMKRFRDFLKRIEGETYPEGITEWHSNLTGQMFNKLIELYNPPKNSRILDIGCGQGPFLELAKSKGFNPVGITLNDEDVAVCRKKGYDVFKMDQSFLDFPDEHFDVIWARHVLEHSVFPLFTLSEYNRVLKKNGLIYIEIPGNNTACKHETNPNHYSVLHKEMWAALLEKTNLIPETVIDINLEAEAGPDIYWAIFCKKKKEVLENSETRIQNSESRMQPAKETMGKRPASSIQYQEAGNRLYLALSAGENFGWGVCSKYLNREVPKLRANTEVWNFLEKGNIEAKVEGTVFHALAGLEFDTLTKLRGTKNIGYTFFENELNDLSVVNAKKYEIVLGGSTWNKEKMIEKGITNAGVLIQGIDPEVFYPVEEKLNEDFFIIFSGGKFELRKGQDIVLKAVKIMQEKYPDVVLVNAWYNMWPKTMDLMSRSKHIKYERSSDKYIDVMNNLYAINGMDTKRIFTYELINNKELREFYAQTDIGLFPNRCEGGTNLVLMEYMACAKPVIASYNTGHKDVLTENNSLILTEMQEDKIYFNNKLWADWQEPSLDEIISKLEYAYHNRAAIRQKGKTAGGFMKKFTWTETARELVTIIDSI